MAGVNNVRFEVDWRDTYDDAKDGKQKKMTKEGRKESKVEAAVKVRLKGCQRGGVGCCGSTLIRSEYYFAFLPPIFLDNFGQ